MTITIETPPELEEAITREAERAGLSVQEYVLRVVLEKADADASKPVGPIPFTGDLLEAFRPYIGKIVAAPGPDDGTGRAWSEIEAACDPL